jgi:murein DD-endopeptidase MepM/ murein hydrolase activator NlpD
MRAIVAVPVSRAVAVPVLLAGAALAVAAAPLPLVMATPIMAVQGQLLIDSLPPGSHGLTIDGQPVHVEPDGRFMLGIDRDASGQAALAWVTPDGRTAHRPIRIIARPWDVDRLPARFAAPLISNAAADLAWRQIRDPEVAAVKAARAQVTPWPFWRAPFRWPAVGRISTHFGAQRIYGDVPAAYHSGMDIAAPSGTPVVAPIPGIVRLARGPFSLEGNIVILDHGQGLSSAFLHLSAISVADGAIVAQGDEIGRIGTTGRSTGPHLHWGLNWHGVRVDPEALLPPPPATVTTVAAR